MSRSHQKARSNRSVYLNLAEQMIEYYDNKVVTNKKFVSALRSYKYSGYTEINQLLYKQPKMEFSLSSVLRRLQAIEEVDKVKSVSASDITEYLTSEYKGELAKLVETIKTLDKIILNAPPITSTVKVYRGARTDIYDDLVCKDKLFYWTSPSFLSTSFYQETSKNFQGRNGIFMTITVPVESQGILLPWDIAHKRSFGNSMIDNEYELVLPRGCTFVVEEIEHIDNPTYKSYTTTYRNAPCEKRYPLLTKHYKMRLVSQHNTTELKRQLTNLVKGLKVTLKPWDLNKIHIDDPKPRTVKHVNTDETQII